MSKKSGTKEKVLNAVHFSWLYVIMAEDEKVKAYGQGMIFAYTDMARFLGATQEELDYAKTSAQEFSDKVKGI